MVTLRTGTGVRLDPLRMLTGELEPTATYSRRSFVWLPAVKGAEGWDGRDGNLTISLRHSARPGAKVETDTYAVLEEPCVGAMGRRFLLRNLTRPDFPDIHETTVGPVCRCTCPGNQAGGLACKHMAALAALIDLGAFPLPEVHHDEGR